MRVGGTSMAAPVVSGIAALIYEKHPSWTPDQVKTTLIRTSRDVRGRINEVNAYGAVNRSYPSSGANAGITPNDLVNATDGEIDYARSSWGRSSWGAAPESLAAGWARSSWGCTCPAAGGSDVQQTRSSWGSATWLVNWNF
jgi:subtilisin family serine protease